MKKNSLVVCDDVSVLPSELGGFGCFANRDFKSGEIIEKGIVYRLNNVDGNINPHLFTWDNERTLFVGASGCLPWYNHSDTPNIKKVGDLNKDTLDIVALRDIKQGEELCNRYISKPWRECFQSF